MKTPISKAGIPVAKFSESASRVSITNKGNVLIRIKVNGTWEPERYAKFYNCDGEVPLRHLVKHLLSIGYVRVV